jgi:hypothetical protein
MSQLSHGHALQFVHRVYITKLFSTFWIILICRFKELKEVFLGGVHCFLVIQQVFKGALDLRLLLFN